MRCQKLSVESTVRPHNVNTLSFLFDNSHQSFNNPPPLQPRKHPHRIPKINRLPRPLIHLILLQEPRKRINSLPWRVREIRPEQHPLGPHKLEQQIELVRTTAQRRVVIEVAGVLRYLLGGVGCQACVREAGGSPGDELGEVAAGVGEDYFYGRGDGAEDRGGGGDEVEGCASGFVAVVDDWLVGRRGGGGCQRCNRNGGFECVGDVRTIGRCGATRLVSTACVGWINTTAWCFSSSCHSGRRSGCPR